MKTLFTIHYDYLGERYRALVLGWDEIDATHSFRASNPSAVVVSIH